MVAVIRERPSTIRFEQIAGGMSDASGKYALASVPIARLSVGLGGDEATSLQD